MPIEIRELVLQARVVNSENATVKPENDVPDGKRLKAEILASCARLIREELSRKQSR